MLAIFLWSYSIPSAQKLGAEWGRQYLCFFFLIEKNAFRLIHLFFSLKIAFPALHFFCVWAPFQPWHSPMVCCDVTLLLSGQSLLPSQTQKSWRNYKSSSAWTPSNHGFPSYSCSSPEHGIRQIHVYNSESSQTDWVRLQRTRGSFMRCT